jgi:hypothetical protein
VTSRCWEATAVAKILVMVAAPMLSAQGTGSVDFGASWVDYEGFLASGAFFVSPTLQYNAPTVSLGTAASYVVFESGNRILQALAAGAWRTRLRDRISAELSGSAGIATYAVRNGEDYPGYGHLLGRARLHLSGHTSGGWLGTAIGESYLGSGSATPVEIELGAWTAQHGIAATVLAKQTWIADSEYLDVVGTGQWHDDHVELDGSLGFRAWSNGAGEGVYGELNIRVPIWKQIAAIISGGRYPSDPVRGVIAANYVSAGLRVTAFSSPTPSPTSELLRELERPEPRPRPGEARITIVPATQGNQTITVEAPGAESVELTADFTDWEPVSLNESSGGRWELIIRVTPGVYRFNLRVNGGPWIAPIGVRAEDGEFGGRVGVLLVP